MADVPAETSPSSTEDLKNSSPSSPARSQLQSAKTASTGGGVEAPTTTSDPATTENEFNTSSTVPPATDEGAADAVGGAQVAGEDPSPTATDGEATATGNTASAEEGGEQQTPAPDGSEAPAPPNPSSSVPASRAGSGKSNKSASRGAGNDDGTASQDSLLDEHEQKYREQLAERRDAILKQVLDRGKAHVSYYQNSAKELLVLQYVENFKRQYAQLFPGRKELLLYPPNEFGIRKFICTTLRPTQLPYKELYDYRQCARFVADYLSFEPLEPSHELPSIVPSPTYTLRLQSGNCFDFAILLVSLLRGVGYDAYVVSGYASKDVTLMDESKTNDLDLEPFTADFEGEDPNSKPASLLSPNGEGRVGNVGAGGVGSQTKGAEGGQGGSKYKVKPPRQLRSMFLMRQEEKKKAELEKEMEARRKQMEIEKLLEDEDDDELKGLRIHAWVLVLPGKREVAEAFFIEPTTGRICTTDNEKYLGVESVFSSQNYWVNMQVCYEGLKGISFDLGDNSKWEFVFLDNTNPSHPPRRSKSKTRTTMLGASMPPPSSAAPLSSTTTAQTASTTGTGASGGAGAGAGGAGMVGVADGIGVGVGGGAETDGLGSDDDDEDEDGGVGGRDVLDLPRSWVERLTVGKEMFESLCPAGKKVVTYRNARHEIFAEYHRQDGMVARITLFSDPDTDFLGEIREYYKNRRDKLWKRIRIPSLSQTHEFFEPGRLHALREHVLVEGRTTEMHFYPRARPDGLVKHLQGGSKIMEFFTEREDRLIYRSVTFDPDDASDREHMTMTKMTEKFERDSDIPAHEDIAKKTYFLREERIRIIYQLEKDRIIPSFREFKHPNTDQKGMGIDLPNRFEVNPYLETPKQQHLYAQLLQLLKSEQSCLSAIKSSDREMKEIVAARQAEEKEVVLVVSVYDTIRNGGAPQGDEKDPSKVGVGGVPNGAVATGTVAGTAATTTTTTTTTSAPLEEEDKPP
ncbi:hypothetical protein HK102_003163, partial [Quaeritorhiza haematococci]